MLTFLKQFLLIYFIHQVIYILNNKKKHQVVFSIKILLEKIYQIVVEFDSV